MDTPPPTPPPGWYPDPDGTRHWRVWTGTQWSSVTRPYGEAPASVTTWVPHFPLTLALARLRRVGVLGVTAGLGLLVGVIVHWPGTAHPVPRWFALVSSDLAIAALVVGTVACAFAVRELEGRWSLEAWLPGVNFFVASALVARRLGRRAPWRLVSEVLLLVMFTLWYRQDPWVALGPVLVAYAETSWIQALIDRVSDASHAVLGDS